MVSFMQFVLWGSILRVNSFVLMGPKRLSKQQTSMVKREQNIFSSPSRRDLLNSIGFFSLLTLKPCNVEANLVQFPCKDGLRNSYHIMRAGQTLLEEKNILETNPLFLTNIEAGLSQTGIEQINTACYDMMKRNVNPSVITYSIAAATSDAVSIISNQLQVGNNRVIPEYTLMDPRGAGKWNQYPIDQVEPAIWYLDRTEAGVLGKGGRTPANDDGTPNETLHDQVIRLIQLLSVLETYYSGDTILLVFPDGTGPALLSCLIAGIPLNRVHDLNFANGEIRYDISYESVRESVPTSDSSNMEELVISSNKLKKLLELELEEKIEDKPVQVTAEKNHVQTPQSSNDNRASDRRNHQDVEFSVTSNKNAFCLFGLIGSGGAAIIYRDNEEKESITRLEHDNTKKVNESKIIGKYNNDDRNLSSKFPELKELEENVEQGYYEVPEMSLISKQEKMAQRTEHAKQKMDEYLNKDDGASDWINLLSELAD